MQFSHKLILRTLFWTALVMSYVFAIVPQDIAPQLGTLSDKSTHFIAFTVLTVLFRLAYKVAIFQTTVIFLGYAVFIELSQYCTPNRCAETLDVVADVIGIGIGLLLYPFVKRITSKYIRYENS